MNKIKIYIFLLAAFYVIAIMSFLFFNLQINLRRIASVNADDEVKNGHYETFHLKVAPKNDAYIFNEYIKNELTGQDVRMEITKMKVLVPIDESNNYYWIYNIVMVVLGIICVFITIYIPVQTFKIVKSVITDKLFDPKNIKRMYKIAFCLLTFYICSVIVFFTQDIIANQIFKSENYKTLLNSDLFFVIFGIVIMIFAEILKYTTSMKEEQDLTI